MVVVLDEIPTSRNRTFGHQADFHEHASADLSYLNVMRLRRDPSVRHVVKKQKKKPLRPTGTMKGANVAKTATGMPEIREPKVFKLPAGKEEAEEFTMNALAAELAKDYVPFRFDSYSRHPKEDGPDFDVIWNGTQAYVELTEYAPLGGPYEAAKRLFTVEEMARGLEERVVTKNKNYKKRGMSPIFLLVYVTDDAFYVSEEVLTLLAYYIQVHSDIIFEAVFFLAFWPDGRPHMRMPFPHREDLRLRDMSRIAKQQVANPDVLKQEIIQSDPAKLEIIVRQYLPVGIDLNLLADSLKGQVPGLKAFLAEQQKNKSESAKVRLPDEAKAAVRSSLKTIEALCRLYDEGNYDTARDIATVIHRMIVDELMQTRLRRALPFISYSILPNPRNLMIQLLTTSMDVRIQSDGGDPTITITHNPLFDEMTVATREGRTPMKFNEWWNGPVQIAGAADGPLIPLNESDQVPYNKRARTTRFDVIRMFRNKTGAHFGREIDADVQKIEDRLLRAIDIRIARDDGVTFSFAETPEVFRFNNSRAEAIVRHIAFEIDKSKSNWKF
jgi:hypothetical protein